MAHLFGDSDASAVEPLLAAVAGNHEFVLVGLPANAPKSLGVVLRFPILDKCQGKLVSGKLAQW